MNTDYGAIGIIKTTFTSLVGMPIQPASAGGAKGCVEVFEEFRDGLKDLDGFSHIILIYHFHLSRYYNLHVVPYLDTEEHGVFATRAPKRPNPIGVSVVRLERLDDRMLYISDIDVIDGTPLLDIKPYVPEFNAKGTIRTGWIEKAGPSIPGKKADDRFIE